MFDTWQPDNQEERQNEPLQNHGDADACRRRTTREEDDANRVLAYKDYQQAGHIALAYTGDRLHTCNLIVVHESPSPQWLPNVSVLQLRANYFSV
jgi:hypothetical protein